MAELFLPHGFSYSEEDVVKYVIEPLFLDNPDLAELFSIETGIKSSKKLDKFSALEKITKAYAQGEDFVPEGGVSYTQRLLEVSDMKAEIRENPRKFYDSIKQELLASGVDANDLESAPVLKELVMNLFVKALKLDLMRQGFFSDTKKETMVNTSGVYSPSGTLDKHYKDYIGFWTRIINDFTAAVIPAAQLVSINSTTDYQTTLAVANVKTLTLSGSSGTGTITINGREYTATYATSPTVTATNFAAANAAAIAALYGGFALTSSGADLILTGTVPGMNALISFTNTGGNLAGSLANTTPAVRNTTLKADAAVKMFEAMWAAAPNELAELNAQGLLRLYVTRSVYDNYAKTLRTINGSEQAYVNLANGQRTLSFNGIAILQRADWDTRINQDFGGVRPHRALLTTPGNLVLGTDGEEDLMKIEAFYDQVKQNNHVRSEYKAGTQYTWTKLIVAAY